MIKVKFFPYQAHCFSFGGFEIQMRLTLEAVRKAGVDASPIVVWDQDNKFDVAHLWGAGMSQVANIRFAKTAGKKVVVTALFDYLGTAAERVRMIGSSLLGGARYFRGVSDLIDALVVVNTHQAEIATRIYGIPSKHVHVIPNVVDSVYFRHFGHKTSTTTNSPRYVLSTGNICQRKNQLALAKACLRLGVNLLLVGRVLEGEDNYGATLSDLAGKNSLVHWIRGLPAGSHDLLSAYEGASIFALVSDNETQPISALEAAALGVPLLLSNRPFAKQKYYTNARLVSPDSVDSICEGIQSVLASPLSFVPSREYLEECTPASVGGRYFEVYERVLL